MTTFIMRQHFTRNGCSVTLTTPCQNVLSLTVKPTLVAEIKTYLRLHSF